MSVSPTSAPPAKTSSSSSSEGRQECADLALGGARFAAQYDSSASMLAGVAARNASESSAIARPSGERPSAVAMRRRSSGGGSAGRVGRESGRTGWDSACARLTVSSSRVEFAATEGLEGAATEGREVALGEGLNDAGPLGG